MVLSSCARTNRVWRGAKQSPCPAAGRRSTSAEGRAGQGVRAGSAARVPRRGGQVGRPGGQPVASAGGRMVDCRRSNGGGQEAYNEPENIFSPECDMPE